MLLSNAELRKKVDIHQDKRLIEWLRTRRIRYTLDGKGHPITTLSAIEKHLFAERKDDEEVVEF